MRVALKWTCSAKLWFYTDGNLCQYDFVRSFLSLPLFHSVTASETFAFRPKDLGYNEVKGSGLSLCIFPVLLTQEQTSDLRQVGFPLPFRPAQYLCRFWGGLYLLSVPWNWQIFFVFVHPSVHVYCLVAEPFEAPMFSLYCVRVIVLPKKERERR